MSSELAKMIDHSALRPETTKDQILRLCDEARVFGFCAVCVAPVWVPLVKEALKGALVRVATVIGFPHGNTIREVKAYEAGLAIEEGAHELDMVINIGALKSRDHEAVFHDISAVVESARREQGIVVKVILETSLLTEEEKVMGCQLAEKAGADFVKTSTGFAAGGVTTADVALIRQVVGNRLGVKAAGGIRDLQTALAMIRAGADRLGCSASVSIMKEFLHEETGK
ncbi:MAG: deoxyribose-phosphate aldolase [Nitrospirota bacterium]